MDLQINKDKFKEYANKAKGVLWLLGATFAAFVLYVLLVVMAVEFPSPDSSSNASETVTWGGLVIPLFLPAIFLRLIKIRLGTAATKVFTTLCTISLIFDLLFAGSMFILRPIHHLFTTESDILSFAIGIGIFLFMANFSRISLLISLLTISENPKRTFRVILLGSSILEIVLICLAIAHCL
jgi:hypothetical protein